MGEGWIKIYRRITDWEWYNHSEMVHLFIHLIVKATPTEKIWQGVSLQRGQVIVGRQKLSAETGISEMTIRTCLNRLKQSGEIEIKSSNRFSIITICNYESYQQEVKQTNQPTNQQVNQPTNHPANHNIRSKEENNNIIMGDARANAPAPQPKKSKDEILQETEKRRKNFYNSLIPYVKIYGKEMVRAFYDYWSELNKSATKMRWEQQQTWELERRLGTWERKDSQYKQQSNGNSRTINTAEQRTINAAITIADFIADDDD